MNISQQHSADSEPGGGLREALEAEVAECAENCDAAGEGGDLEAESYYRGLSQGLRNALAILDANPSPASPVPNYSAFEEAIWGEYSKEIGVELSDDDSYPEWLIGAALACDDLASGVKPLDPSPASGEAETFVGIRPCALNRDGRHRTEVRCRDCRELESGEPDEAIRALVTLRSWCAKPPADAQAAGGLVPLRALAAFIDALDLGKKRLVRAYPAATPPTSTGDPAPGGVSERAHQGEIERHIEVDDGHGNKSWRPSGETWAEALQSTREGEGSRRIEGKEALRRVEELEAALQVEREAAVRAETALALERTVTDQLEHDLANETEKLKRVDTVRRDLIAELAQERERVLFALKFNLEPYTLAQVEAALNPSEQEQDAENCKRCGRGNAIWAASSPLWNAVIRGGSINGEPKYSDMVCATCFMQLAEKQGIATRFRVTAEEVNVKLETTTPSGRVWDEERFQWIDPSQPDPEEGREPESAEPALLLGAAQRVLERRRKTGSSISSALYLPDNFQVRADLDYLAFAVSQAEHSTQKGQGND